MADPSRNATSAYMLVYGVVYSSANVAASRLLRHEGVRARLQELEAENRKRSHLTSDAVLHQIAQLASADPRELTEYRRGACRYCWGEGFLYQRRPQEYRDAIKDYKRKNAAEDPLCLLFDYLGGVGFNQNKEPHPDCPECDGLGVGYTHAKDTRYVSQAVARLFSGVQETKDGFKVVTRSQDKALELAAKHLGLLSEKTNNGEGDVPPAGTVVYEIEDCRVPDAKA